MGAAVAQWLGTVLRMWFDSIVIVIGTGIFYWQSFRSHYGPAVDAASKRNEYQEHFLVVKAAGA
jgi:hypothetical protein